MNSSVAARLPAFEPPLSSGVAVVGLGYVGLPLALQFARSGCPVVGLDIDPEKVRILNDGGSFIHHIPAAEVQSVVVAGTFHASTDFSRVAAVEAVLICVPTPLNRNREPDLSAILNTARSIAPYLKRGMLVCLESTTYPGTTDENLRAILEEVSGLKAGADFHLAFSPERADPGNPGSHLAEMPKIVGGLTPACLDKACAVYRRAVKNLVPVSSCRVAEAAKLLENIFRSVNVALVNELKVVYAAMGIDVWEVIRAASTKPFGFMPFYPGPGLGGHCIPIDPFYLTWKAREYGQHTRFIELAGEINTAMPGYVYHRIVEALNFFTKPVKGSRVLVLGLAYKADVDDMRESPAFGLFDRLLAGGAAVDYHDPFIPVVTPTREHGAYTGWTSVPWEAAAIGSYDATVICTAHRQVNYAQLAEWSSCIIDTRNAMSTLPTAPGQVWKA